MARSVSSIPFTTDGWIEAHTTRLSPATPRAAWEEVLAGTPYLTPGDRQAALNATRLDRAPGAYKAGFHVAPDLWVVVIQGGWYRGVTAVEPEAGGSRMTNVVVNVAPGWTRWVAHVFQARQYRN